ncbi:MAG: bacterioferritin, partial [Candidatus Eisenbacteria bacterium]|nr:bacterioferritin [Candidatus Eisenbacteria bacterium]
MKKDPMVARVIEVLNDVLTAELTAVNQYFVHAEMCQNWGYDRLYHRIRMEAIDEMKHAESLIERVLFLGGIPNVQRLGKINIGETVPEQLKLDHAVEKDALVRL